MLTFFSRQKGFIIKKMLMYIRLFSAGKTKFELQFNYFETNQHSDATGHEYQRK